MDPVKPHSFRVRLLIGFAGLVALLILYVLSFGPAAYMVIRLHLHSKLFLRIYAPVYWLDEKTPLDPPLTAYMNWWRDRAQGLPLEP